MRQRPLSLTPPAKPSAEATSFAPVDQAAILVNLHRDESFLFRLDPEIVRVRCRRHGGLEADESSLEQSQDRLIERLHAIELGFSNNLDKAAGL